MSTHDDAPLQDWERALLARIDRLDRRLYSLDEVLAMVGLTRDDLIEPEGDA